MGSLYDENLESDTMRNSGIEVKPVTKIVAWDVTIRVTPEYVKWCHEALDNTEGIPGVNIVRELVECILERIRDEG